MDSLVRVVVKQKLNLLYSGIRTLSRSNVLRATTQLKVHNSLPKKLGHSWGKSSVSQEKKGSWTARWDILADRRSGAWGVWKSQSVSGKRKQYKEKLETGKSTPLCPDCGSPMRLKRPWLPTHTWKPFWGCTQYDVTGCKGSAKYVARSS
jgi:hypothetical protein